MPGYENAPQTHQLATNCAICARPLCDAASVTAGVGPICRRRHGYDAIPEDKRVEANALIHKIAVRGATVAQKITSINALRLMGCTKIADKLGEFHAMAVVTRTPTSIEVKSKYDPNLVAKLRRVPGRRWNSAKKINVFPRPSGADLLQALNAALSGKLCYGPKGAFAA